ncbi:MAG: tripartite tricarboxylate transporter TctB family protein [Chloroflexi bacterium]|nr:tripartite tricarboxylate transporter TctB family protein [Chloroflexota bacterium]
MKLRGNTYFLMVIAGVMLAAIIASLSMQYFTAKLLPMVIGGAVFALAVTGLLKDILVRDGREKIVTPGKADESEEAKDDLRGYLPSIGWVVAFSLSIYLLGFLIAIPLFALTYMKLHGVKWLQTIVFAILATALVYGIFERLLEVTLYRGLILAWLG